MDKDKVEEGLEGAGVIISVALAVISLIGGSSNDDNDED